LRVPINRLFTLSGHSRAVVNGSATLCYGKHETLRRSVINRSDPVTMPAFDRSAAFCRDASGTVAVLFAGTFMVIIGFIAVAIDYAAATSARATVQMAIDRAAEFAVHRVHEGESAVGETFRGHFTTMTGSNFSNVNLTISSDVEPPAVFAKAELKYETKMLRIVGFPEFKIAVETEARGVAKPKEQPQTPPQQAAKKPPQQQQPPTKDDFQRAWESLPPEVREQMPELEAQIRELLRQ
jgi:hypothetical protein